jgi:primosomal protein N' (replication factor Y)
LRKLGQGTQRIEQVLAHAFPTARLRRVDRDTTRRKGALPDMLNEITSGEVDILVGTQMLSKGHHFPGVTLVIVLDGDAGLYGVDFRAGERMAQQLIQVMGRAGRGPMPGTFILQTHHPEHPWLQALFQHGYAHFADLALSERQHTAFPPYSSLALLRAEASDSATVCAFLEQSKALVSATQGADVTLSGPTPAPMERRAGRYRWQLLVQARSRTALQRMLGPWIAAVAELKAARRVRWGIDVDPIDLD